MREWLSIEERTMFEIAARKQFPHLNMTREVESGDYTSIKTQRLFWIWEEAKRFHENKKVTK